MHPDTYVFLAGERIADLRRDADRRRLTSRAVGGRPTILYREPAARVVRTSSRAPLTGHRGTG
jgi:hypothetical protein